MAVVYIHQPPFFSTSHSYTVSPGSWQGRGAGKTRIMNNYYLKATKESPFCSDLSKTQTKTLLYGA